MCSYYEYVLDRKSTLNVTLIAKLNVCQFALHSNSPNLMFTKCTMYTVYIPFVHHIELLSTQRFYIE